MDITLKAPVESRSRSIELKRIDGLKFEVTTNNGHSFIADDLIKNGGSEEGPSPLAFFTASFAACQAVQVVKVAEAMRFDLAALSITGTTECGKYDNSRLSDPVSRFTGARLVIEIESGESEKRLARLRELAEYACPIGALFADAGVVPEIEWVLKPASPGSRA